MNRSVPFSSSIQTTNANLSFERLYEGVAACLLIFYSLLPGMAKLTGIKPLFVFNIPIILFLLFARLKQIKIKTFDLPFLTFFGLIFLHTAIIVVTNPANSNQYFTAFYVFVLPLLGYFVGKNIVNTETLL